MQNSFAVKITREEASSLKFIQKKHENSKVSLKNSSSLYLVENNLLSLNKSDGKPIQLCVNLKCENEKCLDEWEFSLISHFLIQLWI